MYKLRIAIILLLSFMFAMGSGYCAGKGMGIIAALLGWFWCLLWITVIPEINK